jgi:iron(III) transport system substrate-binding protein
MKSIRTTLNFGLAVAMAGAIMGSLMFSSTVLATTAADVAKLSGPDRAAILMKGAKKEGKVVLYSAMIVNQALRPMAEAFKKKYPFLKVEYWRANSRGIITKVTAELRAKGLVASVIEAGGASQALIKIGALQSFVSPSQAPYPKNVIAAKGYWSATRFNFFGLGYNTKLVSKADVPKTFEELLDPKWKGKFAWIVNSETGSALLFISALRKHMGEKKAEAYLAKLAKQKIVGVSGSARALVDRVVQGEYPMGINIFAHHPIISKRKGASVDTQLLDPVTNSSSSIMFLKAAPHPHAGMMLIDFALSEEGQRVLQKANYLPTHPKVDPKSTLFSILPHKNGKKANFLTPEALFELRGKSLKLQKKYFTN